MTHPTTFNPVPKSSPPCPVSIEHTTGDTQSTPVWMHPTFKPGLGWDVPGAIPEMVQTAWGGLFVALGLKSGDRLLIRGGTTSV